MPKKPKKNPSSSEEELDQSGSEEEEQEEVVAPREWVGRRAKGDAARNTILALTICVKVALSVKQR